MIGFVKGNIEEIYEDRVVIDVNGLGFNVFVSSKTLMNLPGHDEYVKLYTYTSVREDAILLYGFLTRDELELFKKLITVNGIGPKGGLSLLSYLSADELIFAILSSDIKVLSQASGIGKKTAERIVLDLKDKLSYKGNGIPEKETTVKGKESTQITNSNQNEAVQALIALGYSSAESYKAVNSLECDLNSDVETILKEALKLLF